jgi:transposase InsO family protein
MTGCCRARCGGYGSSRTRRASRASFQQSLSGGMFERALVPDLADAREKMEDWRKYYNEERPHATISEKRLHGR